MMDYMSSVQNFVDVGEQYSNHMAQNLSEWHKFVCFYSDANNARKAKDEEYKRDQFIGEEIDWKMLADNMTLFGSQIEALGQDGGFDPGVTLDMNQSIIANNPNDFGSGGAAPFAD